MTATPSAAGGAGPGRAARAVRTWPELLAAVAGAGWFLLLGGGRALPPGRLDWLGGNDWTQHVLGWLFFRRSRWALPLGRIDGFAWPAGTTVGFADANPLLAIPAKLLSPLLPQDFQYIGAWLLACFALQGYFGARLVAVASRRPVHRVLGGALLAVAPPLTARVGHDTLCAHFLLVALVALHLAPAYDARSARRALGTAGVVTVVAGAVHPYLAVMGLALSAALAVRLAACDGALSRRRAGRAVLATTLALVAAFGLLGYLTSAPSHGAHFGRFGTDLLAFANPFGASWLVPERPASWGAWEGNAYLGCGAAVLLVAAAVLALRGGSGDVEPAPLPRRAAAPLLAAAGLLAFFSASDVLRADGREVLSLRGLYRPLAGVVGPFRSSGRFVWPLYYALVGVALASVVRRARRPGVATAVLAAALALQVAELAPKAAGSQFREVPWRFRDARWELARGRYRHLALAPALVVAGGPDCEGPGWDPDAWRAPAYEAYRLGLTVNSGYVARGSHDRFGPPCRAVARELLEGTLARDTVYLVQPTGAAELARHPGVSCGVLDARHVCVAAPPGDPFAAALAGPVARP